jgi:hypothetical protein
MARLVCGGVDDLHLLAARCLADAAREVEHALRHGILPKAGRNSPG